jgi:hypothetical protein
VRVALTQGGQELGDITAHQPQMITGRGTARQQTTTEGDLVRENGSTRKSSTRSSDDEPTRDRRRHQREMARYRPRAAASASFNSLALSICETSFQCPWNRSEASDGNLPRPPTNTMTALNGPLATPRGSRSRLACANGGPARRYARRTGSVAPARIHK